MSCGKVTSADSEREEERRRERAREKGREVVERDGMERGRERR